MRREKHYSARATYCSWTTAELRRSFAAYTLRIGHH